jgi:uncharacterized membrane protein
LKENVVRRNFASLGTALVGAGLGPLVPVRIMGTATPFFIGWTTAILTVGLILLVVAAISKGE